MAPHALQDFFFGVGGGGACQRMSLPTFLVKKAREGTCFSTKCVAQAGITDNYICDGELFRGGC